MGAVAAGCVDDLAVLKVENGDQRRCGRNVAHGDHSPGPRVGIRRRACGSALPTSWAAEELRQLRRAIASDLRAYQAFAWS